MPLPASSCSPSLFPPLPGATLEGKIDVWMSDARAATPPGTHVRAIIAPHAGYRYCGHVMAYAYAHIDPTQV